jgi:YD repeat-containing protein
MKTRKFSIALAALLSLDAGAQNMVPNGINSPTFSLVDQNGVNLTSNKPTVQIEDVGIGSKESTLGHAIFSVYEQPGQPAIGFADSFTGKIQSPYSWDPSTTCPGGSLVLDVVLGGAADRMCGTAGGSFTPQRSTGSSMITNSDGSLTYTAKDGTRFLFGVMMTSNAGLLTQITSPDGKITTLTYRSGVVGSVTFRRLQSVNRNDGLQMKYTYATNTLPASGYPQIWLRVASVTAINNIIDYCDAQTDACSYTRPWPSATQTWTTSGSTKYLTVVDAGGRSTRFTIGIPPLNGGSYGLGGPLAYFSDQLLAVRFPTSTSADSLSYKFCAVSGEFYCMHQGIKKVTANGIDWTYSASSGSGGVSIFIQTTASRPVGGGQVTQQQRGNYAQGPLISFSDGIAQKTFYFESSLANRMYSVLSTDGDRQTYAFDGRGNITQETHTPISGSPLAPVVRVANYDVMCASPVTCNKPNWTRDAKGNQTDYKYDPVHGALVSTTAPPDQGGIRAQTRYAYTQRFAWYKNPSGVVEQAPTPIWVLASQKFCRHGAALEDGSGCALPSDEVITTFDYGPTTGANNLFLRSKAVTANGVTLRTCYEYDLYGNRIGETLPRAGLTSCP